MSQGVLDLYSKVLRLKITRMSIGYGADKVSLSQAGRHRLIPGKPPRYVSKTTLFAGHDVNLADVVEKIMTDAWKFLERANFFM